MVLNDGNKNDLYCKISSKVPCHSYNNETLIKKNFLFTNFQNHPIPHLSMIMHCNKFYEENKIIKVEQALPLRYPRDFSTKIILVFIFITIVYYHLLNKPFKFLVFSYKDKKSTLLSLGFCYIIKVFNVIFRTNDISFENLELTQI